MKYLQAGDRYLLFHAFPYDFIVDLPVNLSPQIILEKTPQEFLENVEPSLADFVLPGYHLPGSGMVHCCLKYTDENKRSDDESSFHFFTTLSALRLQSPCAISVAGKFKVADGGDDMDEFELFEMDSPWSSVKPTTYSIEDIKTTSNLLGIITQEPVLGYKRLTTACIYFAQVTCGFSKSYQLSYLGLFACLESLFVPDGPNKGATLGRRTSAFLSRIQFPFNVQSWLEDEYRNYRNKYAHGVLDISPKTKIRESRQNAFGRLHEIVRLCLLGFLSLDGSILNDLNESGKRSLQRKLDTLSVATGKFLSGQSAFCS